MVEASGAENAGTTPVAVAGLRFIFGSSVLARVRAGWPNDSDCSERRRPVEGLNGRSSSVDDPGEGSSEAKISTGLGGERFRRRLKSECRRSPIERPERAGTNSTGRGARSDAFSRSGTLTAARRIGSRSRSRCRSGANEPPLRLYEICFRGKPSATRECEKIASRLTLGRIV